MQLNVGLVMPTATMMELTRVVVHIHGSVGPYEQIQLQLYEKGIDHRDEADNNVPDEQNQDQERTEHEQRKDQGM